MYILIIIWLHPSPQSVGEGWGERRAALAHMESDCEALLRFLTPGEADRIRAELTEMRLRWEELKFKMEQMDRRLSLSAPSRNCEDAYEQVCTRGIFVVGWWHFLIKSKGLFFINQVKKTMDDLKEKLDCPIMYCISSSDTYKNLLDHMVKDTDMNMFLKKCIYSNVFVVNVQCCCVYHTR